MSEFGMAALRSGPWLGAEVSAVGATGSETSVVGGFGAAPGVTSDVGGGVPTGASCVEDGMVASALVSGPWGTRSEKME